MNRCQGLSLIELLISLLLASLIMTLLLKQYLSSKHQYLDAQARLMAAYDWQLAADLLRNSARQAGFSPCLGIDWLKTRDGRTGADKISVIATNHGAHSALFIARMSEKFSSVLQVLDARHLLVEPAGAWKVNQVVLLADCVHAEIETVSYVRRVGKQFELTLNKPLHFSYSHPIYVGEWLEERFFVQKNGRGKLALFYQSHHSEELSDKIKAFSSRLIRGHQARLLQIHLEFENQPMVLETALRIS